METEGQSVEALDSKIPDHPVKHHRRRVLAEEDATVELQKSVTKGRLDGRRDKSATHTGQALVCMCIAQIQVTSAANTVPAIMDHIPSGQTQHKPFLPPTCLSDIPP